MEINYEKLLDDWAEVISAEMERAEEVKNSEQFGTTMYFLNDGYAKGLRLSMAMLNKMERQLQINMNT